MHQKKRKILYVVTKGNWGGAQKYVYDLATRLPSSYEVVVAIGNEGDALTKKFSEAGIRVCILPSAMRDMGMLSSARTFFDFLRIFKNEAPHIVHLNSPQVGGLGALAARVHNALLRIKYVYSKKNLLSPILIIFTVHGWAWNEDRNIVTRAIIWFLSWLTVLFSHKTIAVSKSVAHGAHTLLFVSGKIVTIENGIELPVFLPREEARRIISKNISIPIPEHLRWVGTIAELHTNKGLRYAVEAMESLPDVTYVVIGEGEQRNSLENLSRSKDLARRVFFIGHIDNASTLLRAFDMFLLPSITEALGYVLLEAGLAGLPTIGTRVGGIPEVIRSGETGILVPPKDPRAIAHALSIFIKDNERAGAYGTLLSVDVKKRFSINRMVKSTEQLYKKS